MTDIRKEFQELLTNYPCSDFQSDEQNYENVLIKTDWILKHIPCILNISLLLVDILI